MYSCYVRDQFRMGGRTLFMLQPRQRQKDKC